MSPSYLVKGLPGIFIRHRSDKLGLLFVLEIDFFPIIPMTLGTRGKINPAPIDHVTSALPCLAVNIEVLIDLSDGYKKRERVVIIFRERIAECVDVILQNLYNFNTNVKRHNITIVPQVTLKNVFISASRFMIYFILARFD